MRKTNLIKSFLISSSFFIVIPASTGTPAGQNLKTNLQVQQQSQDQFINQNQQDLVQIMAERRAQRALEIKAMIMEQNQIRKANLVESRKNLIKNYYARMEGRFMAAIERLRVLVSRIETRLNALSQEEGVDQQVVSEVESSLSLVKEQLDELELELSALSDNIDVVLESEDPKSAFQVIRDQILEIKDTLSEIRVTLSQLIGDIKGLRVGNYQVTPVDETLAE